MQALSQNTLVASEPAALSGGAAGRAPLPPSRFADMRLKVGDQVHLEPPRRVAGGRATVTILGWLEEASVLVTAPHNAAGRLVLQEGEQVLLRAFTGRSAYAFRAAVLKAAHLPFHYLHLSYPDKIEGVEVRKSPRCRLHLSAAIAVGGKAPAAATILDLGTAGALVETAAPLDPAQGPVQIAFSFQLHGVPVALELRAQVRGAKGGPPAKEAPRRQYGVEFIELQPNDRLILGSLVWYQMYEHPRSIS